jgi:hypothetical protein
VVTQNELNGYLGKHISAICTSGFVDNADNHCAHFVSHVLGYRFGATCAMMGNGKGTPASIRVQEVFAHCARVGKWADLPATDFMALAFITNPANVSVGSRTMHNVPRKHVGIYCGGSIWHYSNTQHQVVRQTPAEYSLHYPAPDNAMFWGSIP